MLTDKLNQRPQVVLSEKESCRFILIASSKEESELLQSFLKGEFKDAEQQPYFDFLNDPEITVDMVGEVDEVQPVHVHNIIPKLTTHLTKRIDHVSREKIVEEYCCYQEHKAPNKYNNIVKHEEQLSSFKCACQLLQTKYFIVLKQNKKKDAGDKNRDTTAH